MSWWESVRPRQEAPGVRRGVYLRRGRDRFELAGAAKSWGDLNLSITTGRHDQRSAMHEPVGAARRGTCHEPHFRAPTMRAPSRQPP
jgi:hypothetical protein